MRLHRLPVSKITLNSRAFQAKNSDARHILHDRSLGVSCETTMRKTWTNQLFALIARTVHGSHLLRLNYRSCRASLRYKRVGQDLNGGGDREPVRRHLMSIVRNRKTPKELTELGKQAGDIWCTKQFRLTTARSMAQTRHRKS